MKANRGLYIDRSYNQAELQAEIKNIDRKIMLAECVLRVIARKAKPNVYRYKRLVRKIERLQEARQRRVEFILLGEIRNVNIPTMVIPPRGYLPAQYVQNHV